jgi:hypothetical protein
MATEEIPVIIRDLREDGFSISKGEAKAILEEERDEDYYRWAETGARDFATASRERIERPYEEGMLVVRKPDGTIRFDDRKIRYAGHSNSGGHYDIQLGPTHFGEVQKADIRASVEPAFRDRLVQQGERDFGDSFAYFARLLAVSGVPVTAEGGVHVFKRSERVEMYKSHWHVIAGVFDGNTTVFEAEDPSAELKQQLRANMLREFEEEAASRVSELELIGLSQGIGANFAYIAHLVMSGSEFLESVSRADDHTDHVEAKTLVGKAQLGEFLRRERKIVPAGRGSLEIYLERFSH